MMKYYDGHKGAQTVDHVLDLVGSDLLGVDQQGLEMLTERQLGLVMSAVNRAYHDGKDSIGAEISDDWVYINKLKKGFDFEVLKRLKKTDTRVCNKIYYDGDLCDVMRRMYMTQDDMPYNDRKSVASMWNVPKNEYHNWYCYEYETVTKWELIPEVQS